MSRVIFGSSVKNSPVTSSTVHFGLVVSGMTIQSQARRAKTLALPFMIALSACVQEVDTPGMSRPAYSIIFDQAQPQWARAELSLPCSDGAHTLFSRAPAMHLESQIEDVRCDDVTIEPVGLNWVLPADCKTANWRISLETAEPGAVRPSRQRSLVLDDGWAVISGPTSLLRVAGFDAQTLAITLTTAEGTKASTVAPLHAAPSFYVLGDPPSVEHESQSASLTYIADDLEAIEALVDPALHHQAIKYMREAIGSAQSSQVEDLTVIWFGAERSRAEVSGAAGFDTLIANYVLASDSPTPLEAAAPFVLVLHEHFHQLAIGATPHWVSESLANYYAIKAARRILPDDPGVEAARAMFINPDALVPTGMLELQRRIDEDGDRSGYMQFYSAGATFWAQIDDALTQATDSVQTLDDVLPVILAADYSPNDGLPDTVIEALAAIPEERRAALFDQYL